jgi:hypothetical protein
MSWLGTVLRLSRPGHVGAGWLGPGRLAGPGGRSCARGRGSSLVADAELGGVLVLASGIVNHLDAVARHIILQRRRRSPDVRAGVGGILDNGVNGDHVGAWSSKQDKSNSASKTSAVPADGEGLTDGDDISGAGREDRVARQLRRLLKKCMSASTS